MMNFKTESMQYKDGHFMILDQTMLPMKECWIEVTTVEQMYQIIHGLKVRGASLIGLSAAVFMAKYAVEHRPAIDEFAKMANYLQSSRPTAVHLSLMLQVIIHIYNDTQNPQDIEYKVLEFLNEDLNACVQIAKFSEPLVKNDARILTHCNTGCLIGNGYGSAIGVIRHAHDQGKEVFVYVDETRPLLQGARLTAWEMKKFKIPFNLICDSMAAYLMAEGMIDFVITGADRIAANGDTANKIGTYSLAILAAYHNIPFYIAAPHTTFDFNTKTGKGIIVEGRSENEVTHVITGFGSLQVAPDNCKAFNPAFDVTPSHLITAFITNHGVIYSDDGSFTVKLANLLLPVGSSEIRS